MDKVWPVCARMKEAKDTSRVVALFESEETAYMFANILNDSKPLYYDDWFYYVDDNARVYPKDISLFHVLQQEGVKT